MIRWITRDKAKRPCTDEICFWKRKPVKMGVDGVWDSDFTPTTELTVKDFRERYKGNKLPRKGSCRQVEITTVIKVIRETK